MQKLIEVYRHAENSRVGLMNALLESYGIQTLLRNWHADGALVGVPAPYLYPNICVQTEEDAERARAIIADYKTAHTGEFPAWTCTRCGEQNEGQFGACWFCQASAPT